MTIFRTEHKKNYTVVNNHICKDNRLSWKAKGIWLYAFSRSDDWTFNMQDLINQSTDGRDSVRKGLKELQDAGYLIRTQLRSSTGEFTSDTEWIFFEIPQLSDMCEPEDDFPKSDNSKTEKRPLVSTDILPSTEQHQTNKQHDDDDVEKKVDLVEVKQKIEKLKSKLVEDNLCTDDEFDQFNWRFFSKAIPKYGIRETFQAVLDYFRKPSSYREKINNPPGLVLDDLRIVYSIR